MRKQSFLFISIWLCVSGPGCSPDPCSDPISPEDFAACGPLCGENSPTAASCHFEKPAFPSGIFGSDHESLLEISAAGERVIRERWFMGETGEGPVEILNMPVAGIASTRPAPQLRSSDVHPVADQSEASLYIRYFTGKGACVAEIASVMSWTVRDPGSASFAVPFVRSSIVLSMGGDCSDTLFRNLKTGFAWKTEGQIRRLNPDPCPPPDDDGTPGISDVPPPDCSLDGWCNHACPDDPDCRCEADGVCNPDCEYDPDCDCDRDGTCNSTCPDDPDCDCTGDGICNAACPDDPDCRCVADGVCDTGCTSDPDCPCIEDGICDPDCGSRDPDCLCAVDGRCNCDCLREDPDCGCAADGACNFICGWIDEDCRCLADSVCNVECGESDPDCMEEPP